MDALHETMKMQPRLVLERQAVKKQITKMCLATAHTAPEIQAGNTMNFGGCRLEPASEYGTRWLGPGAAVGQVGRHLIKVLHDSTLFVVGLQLAGGHFPFVASKGTSTIASHER